MSRKNRDLRKPSATQGIKTLKWIEQVCDLADFTDGGAAVGTLVLDGVIPKEAVFDHAFVKVPAAFAGDTSAVLTIGDGSDVDRYNTGTPSVFAAAAEGKAMGVPSGVREHFAATNITLTITSAADWGSVTGGQLIVRLYYY